GPQRLAYPEPQTPPLRPVSGSGPGPLPSKGSFSMTRSKTIGTFPSADPHVPASCVQANARKSPGLDPGPLLERNHGDGHTRKADTGRFCRAHRAPPGNRAPGSGPRETLRSTESYEIGLGPP